MDVMTLHKKLTRTRATIEEGFALPIVIFCLVLMSVLGVAALATSGDEHRASRAMRQGSAAFYAAEAGLNEVYATWDSSRQAAVDTMLPGDSLDLGWRTLANGHSYRALIHRWHNDGSQPMYEVITEGRGAGAGASQMTLSFMLTSASGPGEAYTLGECCEASGVVRGLAVVDGSGTVVDGHDTVPAGWGGAGVCPDSLYDKPGITIKNTSLLTYDPDAILTGEPPVVEDPTINDETFTQFGPDLTWDEIKAMADFTWGSHGSTLELVNQIHPSYNADGTCDTSDPYNWGSNDPANACFDHFPIILIRGDFSIEASYGQGVFILDYTNGVNLGSEFDLDDDSDLNGIILGKGCVELKDRGAFHGAIFVDGKFSNTLCGGDVNLVVKRDAQLHWSQCAVDRAIWYSGLEEFAEAAVTGSSAGAVQLVTNRSFSQVYR